MTLKNLIFISITILFFNCTTKEKKTMHPENLNAVLAYEIKASLGEGAIWNYKSQELYWIDIEQQLLHLYNPTKKTNRSIKMPSHIGTVVPINENEVLSALADGVYKTNLKTGESTLFTDMKEQLSEGRLNDGKCDPAGRFWVGSMHWQQETGKAQLYTIDSKSDLTTKIDSVTISNGIVWTKDKKTMYYIDTPTSQIKSYDFDNDTGAITNGKVAVQIPQELGFPDGMTIDEEDMLWVGMWNGNAVIRFNPKTGEVLQKIEVPAHNITSCAFGGENLDTLFITTASIDMTNDEKEKFPLAGSLFKVVLGVKGVNSTFFTPNTND